MYPNPDPKPNVDSASILILALPPTLQVSLTRFASKVTHVGESLRHCDRVMIARLKRVSGEVRVSGEGHGIG